MSLAVACRPSTAVHGEISYVKYAAMADLGSTALHAPNQPFSLEAFILQCCVDFGGTAWGDD